jgi:hypothetical protein
VTYFELISSDIMSIIRELNVFNFIDLGLYICWIAILAIPLKFVSLSDDVAFTSYVYITAALGTLLVFGIPEFLAFENHSDAGYAAIVCGFLMIGALRWQAARLKEDISIAKKMDSKTA